MKSNQTPPSAREDVAVIQEDREAAYRQIGSVLEDGGERLLSGGSDSLSLVQAFARHRQLGEQRAQGGRKHVLYTKADTNRPDTICDRNGDVVLTCCKICGLAECELDDVPACPGATTHGEAGKQ